jgi:hypothetical protein
MKQLILTLIVFPCALLASWAQPVSIPMAAGRTPDGIIYFLPKTAFRVHLLVEKQTYQPGMFARYAKRYLHADGIAQESDIQHQIVGFEMTQVGLRDTSKCYALKLKGGKCETADIRMSDDGVLLAVNDEPLPLTAHRAFVPARKPHVVDGRQFLNAETRAAGSMAKMAQLTARQMEELQERRQLLITGEADEMPQNERQLQVMLAEIDREYQALRSLFVGTVSRDTTEHTFQLCPQKEMQREVLFRLSRQLGIVDKDDLSGVPYYITLEDLYKTDTAKYPLVENKKNEGLCVNVPGRVRLSLFREQQLLKTFELPAAQFGFVEWRDAQLLKRYVTHLQLHPATGAVVKEQADIPVKK